MPASFAAAMSPPRPAAVPVLRTTKTHCVACQRPTRERVIADRLIRTLPENQRFGGQLRIVQCVECGLRYLNPAPHPSTLKDIYDYDSWGDSTNANPVLQDYFERILLAHGARSVCEIGCGTGDFLARLEAKGLTVTGVEFGEPASKLKFRGRFHIGAMEQIELGDTFDAILLLNTIEHLVDPPAVLAKIHTAVRPGGLFIVRCPNADLFHWWPTKWTLELAKYVFHRLVTRDGREQPMIAGFQYQHLFYFDRRSLTAMLERAGFEIADFSTVDPYNAFRAKRELKRGNVIEGGIAALRHVLGHFGYGPECLVLARRR